MSEANSRRIGYIVKRGTEEGRGVSIITGDKSYAHGFCAGLNRTGKKYWNRVVEIEGYTSGTRVVFEKDGTNLEGTIKSDTFILYHGVPSQWVSTLNSPVAIEKLSLAVPPRSEGLYQRLRSKVTNKGSDQAQQG